VQKQRYAALDASIAGRAANAEVDTARQRAIDEASARIGEVVFELVNQIVGREVDESSHQDLVREAVAALNVEAARGSSS